MVSATFDRSLAALGRAELGVRGLSFQIVGESKPPCRGFGLLPSRDVVLEEDLSDEFATGACAVLSKMDFRWS